MYLPAAFAETDRARLEQFVARHPLATLVSQRDGQLAADHLPFLCEGELAPGGRLLAHVARANPLWRVGEPGAAVLVVFAGADAYVSPSWYPSKPETHRVVPTYNYACVHVHGRLACVHEPAAKLAIVERLTRHFESPRREPWAVADAPADYIADMLAALVAITVTIDSVEAKWKASQNRSGRDQQGVVEGLRREGADAAAAEAAAIIEARLGR